MGSMFVVTVPTREHEAFLRKKDIHISSGMQVASEGAIQSIETSSTGSGRASIASEEYDGFAAPVVIRLEDEHPSILNEPQAEKRKSKSKEKETPGEENAIKSMIKSMFLEKHLEDCLHKFEIMSACWGHSVDGNFSQVEFTKGAEKSENIINHLLTCGIGQKYNSSLCVCSASVYHENDNLGDKDDDEDNDEPKGVAGTSETKNSKTTKWNEFVASIKSRLTVAQVVQGVKANAVMTFDYLVLILVAGIIAGLGLVDDSSVNVVASMLVSPLMGPIMATTFGAVIRDYQLVKTGLLSELVGLLMCLVVGLIFGCSLQMTDRGPWRDVEKWPTDQMRGRSVTNSLIIGVLVAIPSGCGVALSILAGNAGSLVGVAISASLLPPAVNCGILWGLSATIAIKEKMAGRTPLLPCDTFLGGKDPFIDHAMYKKYYFTHAYETIYCKNAAREFAIMGIVSFGLTWLNIFLIFIVGVIILKIKEVAPHTTRQSLNRFWKEDLKVARQFNQQGGTMKGLVDELNETGDREGILKRLEDDRVFSTINRKAVLAPTSNLLDDVQMNSDAKAKAIKSNKSLNNPGGGGTSGWGGWFGFGGSKQEPASPEPDPEDQRNTKRK